MSYIYIVPIDIEPHPWGSHLINTIERSFGFRSRILIQDVDLEKTLNLGRLQFNSSQILLQMLENPPADAIKILGVVGVDLYIPVLTFVFGEAQLHGLASVVSLRRLDSSFYGLPGDNALLIERLVKEAVHELGHNFGLLHCSGQSCVMKASTYVEDIDQKSLDMCDLCRERIRKARRGYSEADKTSRIL